MRHVLSLALLVAACGPSEPVTVVTYNAGLAPGFVGRIGASLERSEGPGCAGSDLAVDGETVWVRHDSALRPFDRETWEVAGEPLKAGYHWVRAHRGWLVVAWILGSALVLARLAVGVLRMRWVVRHAERITDPQLLRHLDAWTDARRSRAARYDAAFEGADNVRPVVQLPDRRHVYHLYIVRVKNRDDLMEKLKELK